MKRYLALFAIREQNDLVVAFMERVNDLLRKAKAMVTMQPPTARRVGSTSGSCMYWREDEKRMLEELDRLFGYTGR